MKKKGIALERKEAKAEKEQAEIYERMLDEHRQGNEHEYVCWQNIQNLTSYILPKMAEEIKTFFRDKML